MRYRLKSGEVVSYVELRRRAFGAYIVFDEYGGQMALTDWLIPVRSAKEFEQVRVWTTETAQRYKLLYLTGLNSAAECKYAQGTPPYVTHVFTQMRLQQFRMALELISNLVPVEEES